MRVTSCLLPAPIAFAMLAVSLAPSLGCEGDGGDPNRPPPAPTEFLAPVQLFGLATERVLAVTTTEELVGGVPPGGSVGEVPEIEAPTFVSFDDGLAQRTSTILMLDARVLGVASDGSAFVTEGRSFDRFDAIAGTTGFRADLGPFAPATVGVDALGATYVMTAVEKSESRDVAGQTLTFTNLSRNCLLQLDRGGHIVRGSVAPTGLDRIAVMPDGTVGATGATEGLHVGGESLPAGTTFAIFDPSGVATFAAALGDGTGGTTAVTADADGFRTVTIDRQGAAGTLARWDAQGAAIWSASFAGTLVGLVEDGVGASYVGVVGVGGDFVQGTPLTPADFGIAKFDASGALVEVHALPTAAPNEDPVASGALSLAVTPTGQLFVGDPRGGDFLGSMVVQRP